MNPIETTAISKIYGSFKAVNKVSLQVPHGEIYGFLGLNGAGKTTSMRMLLGMIKPNEGEIRLFGETPKPSSPIWQRVGYMIESTYAYPALRVNEYLKVFANYYGIRDKQAIPNIISKLGLERYQNVQAQALSLGNLQRLGLAKALLHQPELLLLDEPTNGLDPAGIVEIRKLLKHLSQQGTTILISSHLLSEISKIADRIGIIHQGELIKEIETKALQKELRQFILLNTDNNPKASKLLQAHGFSSLENPKGELVISGHEDSHTALIADLLVQQNIKLFKLLSQTEDLESYFMRSIQANSL